MKNGRSGTKLGKISQLPCDKTGVIKPDLSVSAGLSTFIYTSFWHYHVGTAPFFPHTINSNLIKLLSNLSDGKVLTIMSNIVESSVTEEMTV